MVSIKDSKGKVLFEGSKHLVKAILNLAVDVEDTLILLGYKDTYNRDRVLNDCIKAQIKLEEMTFETGSEVKDFRKSFKIYI